MKYVKKFESFNSQSAYIESFNSSDISKKIKKIFENASSNGDETMGKLATAVIEHDGEKKSVIQHCIDTVNKYMSQQTPDAISDIGKELESGAIESKLENEEAVANNVVKAAGKENPEFAKSLIEGEEKIQNKKANESYNINSDEMINEEILGWIKKQYEHFKNVWSSLPIWKKIFFGILGSITVAGIMAALFLILAKAAFGYALGHTVLTFIPGGLKFAYLVMKVCFGGFAAFGTYRFFWSSESEKIKSFEGSLYSRLEYWLKNSKKKPEYLDKISQMTGIEKDKINNETVENWYDSLNSGEFYKKNNGMLPPF